MQRTNSRIVKLPILFEEHAPELTAGLTKDQIEELNLRAYDYGRRADVPTLDGNIITPFSETRKKTAYEEAIKIIGLDSEGILREKHTRTEEIGDKKIAVKVYPSSTTAFENIILKVGDLLEHGAFDKEMLIDINNKRHIIVGELIKIIGKLKDKHTTKFNKKDLALKDLQTGKELELNEGIKEMVVYLDPKRYMPPSPQNINDFYSAQSLKALIEKFLKDFAAKRRRGFGIQASDLTEDVPIDFELSDGSAVRYLFYPKKTTAHGKIFYRIAGKNQNNVESYGDLTIIKDFSFKEPTEIHMKKGDLIKIDTPFDPSNKKRGDITILRVYSDGKVEKQKYSVYKDNGNLYVCLEDFSGALDNLNKNHTKVPTKLKIDFFAAPPPYLI